MSYSNYYPQMTYRPNYPAAQYPVINQETRDILYQEDNQQEIKLLKNINQTLGDINKELQDINKEIKSMKQPQMSHGQDQQQGQQQSQQSHQSQQQGQPTHPGYPSNYKFHL